MKARFVQELGQTEMTTKKIQFNSKQLQNKTKG